MTSETFGVIVAGFGFAGAAAAIAAADAGARGGGHGLAESTSRTYDLSGSKRGIRP